MKNNDFKESAPIFTKRLIDRRVEVNSTVRLSCQVYGLPVPAVMWYKDGEPLDFAGTILRLTPSQLFTNVNGSIFVSVSTLRNVRRNRSTDIKTAIHTNDYFLYPSNVNRI